MNNLKEALLYTFAMGAVILFCRALPFIVSGGGLKTVEEKSSIKNAFLDFAEKIVPPAAMTVLAFNALGSAFSGAAFRESISGGIPALAASVFTCFFHLWKGNPLISIFGGTALYMALIRLEIFM